jgi:hypothetical protein
MGAFYVTTYRPICATAEGRRAVDEHQLAPFIDASCRREPDFEAAYPTISALCRGGTSRRDSGREIASPT